MDKLLNAVSAAETQVIKGDFIDRLHSRVTVIILFGILILVGIKQWDDKSILCWTDTQITGDQVKYAHQLCWVNNTYYYPGVYDVDLFPASIKYTVRYYQYILFILLGQALLFYVPAMLWKVISKDFSSYIKKVLDQVSSKKLVDKEKELLSAKAAKKPEMRSGGYLDNKDEYNPVLLPESTKNELLPFIKPVIHVQNVKKNPNEEYLMSKSFEQQNEEGSDKHDTEETEFLRSRSRQKPMNDEASVSFQRPRKMISFNRFGSTKKKIMTFMKPLKGVRNLWMCYILLKLFNILNVIIQMYVLNRIFGREFFTYGLDFIENVFIHDHKNDNEYPVLFTRQFPIITFCEFFVYKHIRQIHFNVAQCLLTINVFIEKFYVIIWYWYVMLLILTFLNILSWLHEIYIKPKVSFIYKYLYIRALIKSNELKNSISDKNSFAPQRDTVTLDEKEIETFQNQYLGKDGLVMMHLIKNVAGDLVFMDILHELWIEYEKNTAAQYYHQQQQQQQQQHQQQHLTQQKNFEELEE
jgi:hypothetical protein